jgi:hypothetical protein
MPSVKKSQPPAGKAFRDDGRPGEECFQQDERFSRRETLAYYRDIMDRAWAQVEAADTPEVKGQSTMR